MPIIKKLNHLIYRAKYVYAPYLNLSSPVDVSLELASACTNTCGYCLHPDTLVLNDDLSWVRIDDLSEGDRIVSFDEESSYLLSRRKMNIGVIEKKWKTKKSALKVVTEHGSFVCSSDHKFLNARSSWIFAGDMRPGTFIKYSMPTWVQPVFDNDYMRGYLRGITEGDGTARWHKIDDTSSGRQVWWRIAMIDDEPLIRSNVFLNKIGINTVGIRSFPKSNPKHKAINKIEFRSKNDLKKLFSFLYEEKIENIKSFEVGYLCGAFDSEGSYSQVIRISQINENDLLDRCINYGKNLGFNFVKEKHGIRLLGGLWENLRFLGVVGASIKRTTGKFSGLRLNCVKSKVLSIEDLGEMDLVDIQTSTKTFFANGFPTHNCYHADTKTLPFKRGFMSLDLAKSIILEGAQLGVHSVKFNYRGEATLNPNFKVITDYAKKHAAGSTYIDRILNSNFNFKNDRWDIFEGLCNQTKVKVSFDSFIPEIFEKQRRGSNYSATINNIDKFYNIPWRKTELVIQAVRTKLNENEDLEFEIKKRWPEATASIRDVVEGRTEKNISNILVKKRSDERKSCIQAHARLIVHHDGKVSPCCPSIKGDLLVGDFTRQSMFEIWNGDAALALRKELKNKKAFVKDPCKTCSSHESYAGYKPTWSS